MVQGGQLCETGSQLSWIPALVDLILSENHAQFLSLLTTAVQAANYLAVYSMSAPVLKFLSVCD